MPVETAPVWRQAHGGNVKVLCTQGSLTGETFQSLLFWFLPQKKINHIAFLLFPARFHTHHYSCFETAVPSNSLYFRCNLENKSRDISTWTHFPAKIYIRHRSILWRSVKRKVVAVSRFKERTESSVGVLVSRGWSWRCFWVCSLKLRCFYFTAIQKHIYMQKCVHPKLWASDCSTQLHIKPLNVQYDRFKKRLPTKSGKALTFIKLGVESEDCSEFTYLLIKNVQCLQTTQ